MSAHTSSLIQAWYISPTFTDESSYKGNPSLLAYTRVHLAQVRTANVLIDTTEYVKKNSQTLTLSIPIPRFGDFTRRVYLRLPFNAFNEGANRPISPYLLYSSIATATLKIGGGIIMERLTGEWMLMDQDLRVRKESRAFPTGRSGAFFLSLPFCFSRPGNPLPCSYMAQEAEIDITFTSASPWGHLIGIQDIRVFTEYTLIAEPYRSKLAAYSEEMTYWYDTYVFSGTQWCPSVVTLPARANDTYELDFPYTTGLCKCLFWVTVRDTNTCSSATTPQPSDVAIGGSIFPLTYDNTFTPPTTMKSCELVLPGIGSQPSRPGYYYTRLQRYLHGFAYSSELSHESLQHIHMYSFAHDPLSIHDTGHVNLAKMDGHLRLRVRYNGQEDGVDDAARANTRLGVNMYMQTIQVLVIKGLQAALLIEPTFV